MKKDTNSIWIFVFLFILIAYSVHLYRLATSEKEISKQPKVLVVIKAIDFHMEFWDSVLAGIDTAAKEFDVEIAVTGSRTEQDIDEQIDILEKAIKDRPDAIILAADDYYATAPVVEKICKANIKLILIDSGINSDLPDCFIATDSFEAGKKAGKKLSEIVNPGSEIAIISHVKGSSTAIERELGVREGLAPGLRENVIGVYYSNAEQEKAYEIMRNLIAAHPNLKGVVGLNESSTVGAANAINDMGMKGKVRLIGFDSSLSEVSFIEKGTIQATVVQKPFNMGYLSVKTAVQLLNGKKPDKKIDTGSVVIIKENIYTEENQKLLFPFTNN